MIGCRRWYPRLGSEPGGHKEDRSPWLSDRSTQDSPHSETAFDIRFIDRRFSWLPFRMHMHVPLDHGWTFVECKP
jgi:hypothetical protein